jgi:hypothetical protein
MTPRYVKQKMFETKRNERARQDLQPSLTRRQVTRLQLKTIVERFSAVIPLFKVRRELSH